ncbi:Predicted drug exporters of the RND superfamily [Streptomyces sp. AmelKG-E11A]|nr:Predicted drug exporters of the RND superfamily [Streptomyces sp. AmelKG-E11A]
MHTGDNARAVGVGLAETSRVINCAELIMICVFSAFVLSGDMEGAVAGVGLAVAVAVDAFVLRTARVPAVMHLLGRANWWLPGWLERRLPHLAVEAPQTPVREAGREAAGALARGGAVLHGFIRTTEGGPVAGATVTLRSVEGDRLDRVTSPADGSYVLAAPAPGPYLLVTGAEGLGERTLRVMVPAGPMVHDVELAGEGVRG